jgi:hypothetical protein
MSAFKSNSSPFGYIYIYIERERDKVSVQCGIIILIVTHAYILSSVAIAADNRYTYLCLSAYTLRHLVCEYMQYSDVSD